MTKNIQTHNPLYDEFRESWDIMRDTIGGEDDVKDKDLIYLPMKSGMLAIKDATKQSAAYLAYQKRAEFPELVAPTVRGSAGLITDKMPAIEMPSQMEYLVENCDGTGKTLDMFFKQIVTEVMNTGRYGVLPGVKGASFVLTGYTAEKIINWDVDDNGKPDYVVLDETKSVRNRDTNVWAKQEMFLECYINDNGGYEAQKWVGNTPSEEPVEAMLANQQKLDFLPFVFINSSNLDPDPDDVPLYGLAKLALRIYRFDADYSTALHWTSEPTPWVSGYDDPKDAIKNGEVPSAIGASNIWILPQGGQAGFLEFNGPGVQAQQQAIQDSLTRAVMFGAQIFSDQTNGVESGESRKLRMRGQHSLIRNVAVTAAAGLELALRNVAKWMGLDPKQVTVKPNLDFVDYTLTAQEVTALVAGWQSGAYSKRTLFENFQRADMISSDRTFEEEQDLIDEEGLVLGTVGRTDGNGNGNPAGTPGGSSTPGQPPSNAQ